MNSLGLAKNPFHSHRALARWKGFHAFKETVLTVSITKAGKPLKRFSANSAFYTGLKPGVMRNTFEQDFTTTTR